MSLSMPAMIFSSVDLPEPFSPSTPILAPGKKLREMSLRICRFGGTILPRRFIVKTYCAIGSILLGGLDDQVARDIAASHQHVDRLGLVQLRDHAGVLLRRRDVGVGHLQDEV